MSYLRDHVLDVEADRVLDEIAGLTAARSTAGRIIATSDGRWPARSPASAAAVTYADRLLARYERIGSATYGFGTTCSRSSDAANGFAIVFAYANARGDSSLKSSGTRMRFGSVIAVPSDREWGASGGVDATRRR
jgi:hypothetical protein